MALASGNDQNESNEENVENEEESQHAENNLIGLIFCSANDEAHFNFFLFK